jgi:hypothetical protein
MQHNFNKIEIEIINTKSSIFNVQIFSMYLQIGILATLLAFAVREN